MQIELPPDLVAFVVGNSGDGAHFRSADEFVAAVLQEKRERLEIEAQELDQLDTDLIYSLPGTLADSAR